MPAGTVDDQLRQDPAAGDHLEGQTGCGGQSGDRGSWVQIWSLAVGEGQDHVESWVGWQAEDRDSERPQARPAGWSTVARPYHGHGI
jgi:hypothetical protein